MSFQGEMNGHVKEALPIGIRVFRRQGAQWHEITTNQDLDEGVDYRLDLRVYNDGDESDFRRVQIRCRNDNTGRITFYKNEQYQEVVPRVDSPIWFTQPGELLTVNHFSETHRVYFRVRNDPDSGQGEIAAVGVYAVLEPKARYWKDVKWKL